MAFHYYLLDQLCTLCNLRFDRFNEIAPGRLFSGTRYIFRFLFNRNQFLFGSDSIIQDKLAQFAHTVHFLFPFQALLRFVTLMRTGSRVTLRLCYFLDVEQGRNMIFSYAGNTFFKRFYQAGIIPSFYTIYFYTAFQFFIILEAGSSFRY
ncbi:hypothetical protein D3C80_1492960 [compost metagenome]